MESEYPLSTVPKLQGKSNYQQWALHLEAISEFGGYWPNLVDENIALALETPSTDAIKKGEHSRQLQLEMKAKGAIKLTVSDVIKLDLQALKVQVDDNDRKKRPVSAHELWKYLKLKYEVTKYSISALLDFKKFFHVTIVDDGTLEDQLNAYHELRARCAINNMKVPDWQYAVLILLALPNSFSHVQESFLTTGLLGELKPDEVCARVLKAGV